jgi:hypothetical protein
MRTARARRVKLFVGALAGAVALGLTATTAGAAVIATLPGGAGPGAEVVGTQPRVPALGAYIGVDANFDPAATPLEELQSFQGTVGRTLGISSLYKGFTNPMPTTTLVKLAAEGSIPMISWHCGGLDAATASGAYDATITAQARALKSFGYPVLLRWMWEMNLPTANNNPSCLGPSATAAANYVAAFRHIVNVFRRVGATNVAFVWSPSAAVNAASAVAFYPGSQYVDWIGFDLYDRADRPQGFAASFAPTYATYASYGKPMAITETGAVGGATGIGGGSPTQAQWLGEIAASLPTSFPKVHALVYVDAIDLYNYEFDGPGLTQFRQMCSSVYFSALG